MSNASTLTAVRNCIIKTILLLFISGNTLGQARFISGIADNAPKIFQSVTDVFGTKKRFIENKGQYGDQLKDYENCGRILYGYEGFAMPVLFTNSGFIQLQRKLPDEDEAEKEKREHRGRKGTFQKSKPDDDELPEDRTVSVQWINVNPQCKVTAEGKSAEYHTYGQLQEKASAWEKLIYKEIYPGIDLEYFFTESNQ